MCFERVNSEEDEKLLKFKYFISYKRPDIEGERFMEDIYIKMECNVLSEGVNKYVKTTHEPMFITFIYRHKWIDLQF